ncbi:MAG: hypothetical protein JGK33_29660 [Microcoleus sp. PH2017_11_PCY_U_A]|uniref:hypothetical protein n=1 Tax=unclassified Microcoleus TaxID=2642155 RepID=UPI001E108E2F|nr:MULTISPECIES: hypothetical protein [unclassified Microcoleus]MCC3463732.1 hypothetical protein [Microcoleus sp. PH2017_11_PCY_U_A]
MIKNGGEIASYLEVIVYNQRRTSKSPPCGRCLGTIYETVVGRRRAIIEVKVPVLLAAVGNLKVDRLANT